MGELSDGQDLSAAESPAQAKVMHYLQFISGVLGQVCESRQRRVLCGLSAASLTLLCHRQGLCCPTPRHGSFSMPSASLARSSTASRQHSAPPSPYRVPPSPPRLMGSTQRRSRWHALVSTVAFERSRTEGTALLITDGAALQAAGLWSSPTRTAARSAPL